MTLRQVGIVAGLGLVALGGSFVAGRYSRPAKVVTTTKTETKTVTQTQYVDRWHDRIVYVQAKARHVETTTMKMPTGEVVITRVEDTRTDIHADQTSGGTNRGAGQTTAATVAETKTVTIYDRPRLRLAYTPGVSLTHPLGGITHGGEVDYRIFGPFQLGAWARSDRTAGAAIAVEF